MTRADLTSANNARVRAFAEANRLMVFVGDDGEVVIPCGPGRATIHLGFGYRIGLWYVCAIDLSVRQASAILATLDGTGDVMAQHGDAEFIFVLPHGANPLSVLDRHDWTSPRRRRKLSDEVKAAATERLAAHRRRSASLEPAEELASTPEDRMDASGPTSEPSAASVPSNASERSVVGGGRP